MPNINTAVRILPHAVPNPNLVDLTKDFGRKSNAAFLAEVARRLRAAPPGPAETSFDSDGIGCIGLIGEYSLIAYGIRGAQELVRSDHTASYWSHAFLITSALSTEERVNRSKRSAWIWESTLEPADFSNKFIERNGVAPRRISDYAESEFDLLSAHSVPNFAVLAVALTKEEKTAILDRADDPDVDQLHYDLAGLLGTWYAYLTNRANERNPLSEGCAIYCSAYVQLAYEAAGIDLAPGAHQKNTCPEHIWQAFKYLQIAFQITDPATGELVPRPMIGFYCVRDKACVVAPVDLVIPRRLSELTESAEPPKPA